MNLFVIGNGFDKAHLLKTDYVDFRNFLYDTYPDFLSSFENAYGNCLESDRELVNESLWRLFEENLSCIEEDCIVESASAINLGLEGGDIDVENMMTIYWERYYSYIKELRCYLRKWIATVDTNVTAKTQYIQALYDEDDNVTEDIFLSFNYTLVLENVYKIPSSNICHIHGSIADRNNALVIGHGNKEKFTQAKLKMHQTQKKFEDKKSSIYNALSTYYKRTTKDVGLNIDINKNFFSGLDKVASVYIVGHSLGEVDLPYFVEIQKNVSHTTQWIIICRNNLEEPGKRDILNKIGVQDERITFLLSSEFFNKEYNTYSMQGGSYDN